MEVLWVNLGAVFVSAYFARWLGTAAPEGAVPAFQKPNKLFAAVVFIVLAVVSGLRSNIGDTYFYKLTYENVEMDLAYVLAGKDIGFGLLQMMLQQISRDSQLLILVTAVISNLCVVAVLYRYSRMFEISMYVYITSGLFLISMNGIRQFLAAAILFAAAKFLFNGERWKYYAVVVTAALFHATALIMIPIYFIVRRKAWSGVTLALLAGTVLVVIGFNSFTSVLFSVIENTQYSQYQAFDEGGANVIRVLVEGAPLMFAFWGRKRLQEICPHADVIVNMSLIGVVFMMISTQNWIFARFAMYFSLYNLILVSWIMKLIAARQQRIFYYALLICYFLYYFYESVIALGIEYRSNYL